MNIHELIKRDTKLFDEDIKINEKNLKKEVSSNKFLIIGGAGSIGQAITKELFKRDPITLHVIDINENNLVELVRDIRSSMGYIKGDFKTFILDCGSSYFESFFETNGPYDYVLNLSAIKHVRSEKDPYSIMRMIDINIINTINTLRIAEKFNAKKYFCVSTDKATYPVNMMGASKRIMENFLLDPKHKINVSTTRFANVAFSDGSLLHGFKKRIEKRQPIVAPRDIKRYFITPEESGQLCLLSCLMGKKDQIYYPIIKNNLKLISFSDIAINFINQIGYEYYPCKSEEEAKNSFFNLINTNKWPCYFFKSDTTGEKYFEEFFETDDETDENSFKNIGIVKNCKKMYKDYDFFLNSLNEIKKNNKWTKVEIIKLFKSILPEFNHLEKGKNLDQKM